MTVAHGFQRNACAVEHPQQQFGQWSRVSVHETLVSVVQAVSAEIPPALGKRNPQF